MSKKQDPMTGKIVEAFDGKTFFGLKVMKVTAKTAVVAWPGHESDTDGFFKPLRGKIFVDYAGRRTLSLRKGRLGVELDKVFDAEARAYINEAMSWD